jgi:hypothetical protein
MTFSAYHIPGSEWKRDFVQNKACRAEIDSRCQQSENMADHKVQTAGNARFSAGATIAAFTPGAANE